MQTSHFQHAFPPGLDPDAEPGHGLASLIHIAIAQRQGCKPRADQFLQARQVFGHAGGLPFHFLDHVRTGRVRADLRIQKAVQACQNRGKPGFKRLMMG